MEHSEADRLLVQYKIIRSYIEHEDRLIGDRISRTLLAHGFLIASFVLLLQARVGAAAQCLARDNGCLNEQVRSVVALKPESKERIASLSGPDDLAGVMVLAEVIMPFIALIGLLAAGAAYRGVQAAEKAIQSVRKTWEESSIVREAGGIDVLKSHGIPVVTGGGHPDLETDEYSGISVKLLFFLRLLWGGILLASAVALLNWNWTAAIKLIR
ncbi:MAG: hypothetical protein ACKVP7_10805 [Hyphomicrobiaceae bacterium]